MSQEQWTAVDDYIASQLIPADPVFEAALADARAADLPAIQVAPNQGKLLALLVQALHARNVLEIGTLGGYSALWLARALPADGRLVTLELEPKHAEIARKNLQRAGVAERVEIRVGPALDTLPKLRAEGRGPFDLIFIDADKASLADYFSWSLELARPGTLIIADNVIRKGAVVDAASSDANVRGVRRLNEALAKEPRVTATALQTVGSKGYDGLAFILVQHT